METTVTERPILFSTDMILAMLSGQKTETRRDKGLKQVNKMSDELTFCKMELVLGKNTAFFDVKAGGVGMGVTCPYGKPGDRLWVRETWAEACDEFGSPIIAYKYGLPRLILKDKNTYTLGGEVDTNWSIDSYPSCGFWKPSIHMSRWTSRILLEIVYITVQRLHDITEEEAKAEGVEPLQGSFSTKYRHYCPTKRFTKEELADGFPFCTDARASFFTLWISLKGEESLNKNPWVWVVKFKVVEVKQ